MGNSIICISINEWADVPRNQVQLMRIAVRRGYSVLYVESIGLRRPEWTRRDAAKVLRRLRRLFLPLRREDQLWVLSPFVLPFHGSKIVDAANRLALGLQVAVAGRILGFRRPVLWSYLPQGLGIGRLARPGASLYFRCDDYTEFRGVDVAGVIRLEERAVKVADLCVASSKAYLDGALANAKHVLWSPNAVDLDHYAERGSDPYEDVAGHTLLMMGTLEYWLDVKLLCEVARLRPEWSIVLAGPLRTDLTELLREPNARYLGVLPYGDLPRYVGWADVCLIPFQVIPVTAGANPGKLFQYLGAGKPVVTTDFLDLTPFGHLVHVVPGGDSNAFVHAVEFAIEQDSESRADSRREAMRSETWEARFAEIEHALTEATS